MKPERYQRLKATFDACCDGSRDQRLEAVAALRREDVELGDRLAALLEDDARDTGQDLLKPANVLSSGDVVPQPKLADFGIAKLRDASGALTSAGAIIGSIDFLLPEQVGGGVADARSDLYASAA